MRLIRWTTEASDHFEAAIKYIEQDNPEVARKAAQMIIDRIEQLARFPGMGRPGEVKGTRELVVSPYVVVYRHTDEIVEFSTSGTERRTGVDVPVLSSPFPASYLKTGCFSPFVSKHAERRKKPNLAGSHSIYQNIYRMTSIMMKRAD